MIVSTSRLRAAVFALPFAGLLALATTYNAGAQASGPEMLDSRLAVRTVVSGLALPIGIAFLGPNDMFVLEKDTGRVIRVVNGVARARCSISA